MNRPPNPLMRWAGLFLIGIPVLAFAGGAVFHLSEVLAYILFAGSGLCGVLLIAALFYEVMTRLQWRTLELLCTLVVGTLPLAFLAPHSNAGLQTLQSTDFICLAIDCFAGLACTFAGSVGAMAWITRLNEQRTFHRLVLMALGWVTIVSFCLLPIGVISLAAIALGEHRALSPANRENWKVAGYCLSSCLSFIPVVIVERRARAAELSMRARRQIEIMERLHGVAQSQTPDRS